MIYIYMIIWDMFPDVFPIFTQTPWFGIYVYGLLGTIGGIIGMIGIIGIMGITIGIDICWFPWILCEYNIYIYIYLHIHIYIHIFTYTYIHIYIYDIHI